MAARDIVPVPGARFEETLASASPDVLREMIKGFAQRMMDAEAEVRCNAGYGEVTRERVNSRNGYRLREWDTRAGTIELAIPKLRQGTYYPEFLEHGGGPSGRWPRWSRPVTCWRLDGGRHSAPVSVKCADGHTAAGTARIQLRRAMPRRSEPGLRVSPSPLGPGHCRDLHRYHRRSHRWRDHASRLGVDTFVRDRTAGQPRHLPRGVQRGPRAEPRHRATADDRHGTGLGPVRLDRASRHIRRRRPCPCHRRETNSQGT